MGVHLNPYLNFRTTAADAMAFYQSVFGGELTITKFGDMQMPGIGPEEAEKVMHAQLEFGDLSLMAADVPEYMPISDGRDPISLSGDDEATLRGWWDGLAEGGEIAMPLNKAPWGDTFGQLTDKFGVMWLVNIAGSPA